MSGTSPSKGPHSKVYHLSSFPPSKVYFRERYPKKKRVSSIYQSAENGDDGGFWRQTAKYINKTLPNVRRIILKNAFLLQLSTTLNITFS